ncbi:hypothetical protein EHM76_05865, partial [bacterium]
MKKLNYFVIGLISLSGLLSACCSSGKTVSKTNVNADSLMYRTNVTLPPGNADIRVLILETTDLSEDNINCKVQVEEVTGYGAATPPLAVGAE